MKRHFVTPEETIRQTLKQLVADTADVEGAVMVNPDGLAVTSVLPAGIDVDRISEMTAALLSLSERAAAGMERGRLEQVHVKGAGGYTIFIHLEGGCVLGAVTAPGAKLGMVLLDIESAAEKILGITWETNKIRIDDETKEILLAIAGRLPARQTVP